MSGFFVVGEKKERPGVYKRYENAGGVEAAGARSGVGCALVTGNWGALNTPVTIDQSTDVSNVIGAGSGYDAITAFMAGGMEECVVVRVGTGGTPATITLKDTTASNSERCGCSNGTSDGNNKRCKEPADTGRRGTGYQCRPGRYGKHL